MSFAGKGAEVDDPSLSNLRIGQDGWLYSWSKGLSARQDGSSTYHPAQIAAILENLDSRAARVRAVGAQYVFFVSPDKTTIYPEHLPEDVIFSGESHLSQLRPHLSDRNYCFDLFAPLASEKTRQRVYFKTDSHWNYQAGRIAADKLLNHLGQHPLNSADFVETTATQIMDLGRYVDPVEPETFVKYTEPAEKPFRLLYTNGKFSKARVQVFEGSNPNLPTCLMFRDSYSSFFINYLINRFSRITLVATRDFYDDILESERPDIVITQIAERYLGTVRKDHLSPSCEETFGVTPDFLKSQSSQLLASSA